MPPASALRAYQHQAIHSASPAELIDKLYGIGLTAAQNDDTARTRRVLVELVAAVDTERGGDLAEGLIALYDFALRATSDGDLKTVAELLSDLRETWREATLGQPAQA
ncbi:MAG: flagellar export chaperone FliS [Bacteroidota bacterium]